MRSGETTERTLGTCTWQRTRRFLPGGFLNGTNVDSSGEAEQGMALSRLLLLCMVASEVLDAETKPIDFVCNRTARRVLNIVAEMESALSGCGGVATLSAPIQLPCTELHVASWENKSHQERRGDIVASLRLLIEGVEVERSLSVSGCGASLLQRLENNANNYLVILTHLQLNDKKKIAVHTFLVRHLLSKIKPEYRVSQSLSTVLLRYNQLISGKLETFMLNMEDRCTRQ